jgi:hypothetical protein
MKNNISDHLIFIKSCRKKIAGKYNWNSSRSPGQYDSDIPYCAESSF